MPSNDLAERLTEVYGPDPSKVGAIDGTEDDWGDLINEAAEGLGFDPEAMSQDDWDHFQNVAAECRSTNMADWLAHLAAITRERN